MSGHDFANPNPKPVCPEKTENKCSSAEKKCKKKYNPHNPCEQDANAKKKCVKPDPCHKYTPKDK